MNTTVLAWIAILGPLLLNALWGTRLPSTDDAAIAERWLAFNKRALLLSLAGAAAGFVIAGLPAYGWVAWYFAYVASLRPARRRVLGETAALHVSLLWHTRILVITSGWFLGLALLPPLAHASGPHVILASAVGAGALFLYAALFPRIAPRVLGATPIADPALQPLFARVLAQARCEPPIVYRAGSPGCVLANAFAVPSVRRPSVIFLDTLLANLEPAETAAVFAHEVAHLEHYDRRRLRRSALATAALTVLAGACAPLARLLPESMQVLVLGLWSLTILLGFSIRAMRHQAHERESDLRALELTGDGEALIRGLVKLHALNRLPRRWAANAELAASHPSLARRIKALRARMGDSSAHDVAAEPLAVRDAARPDRYVVLDRERVQWLAGVPQGIAPHAPALREAARRIEVAPYAELRELLVRPGPFRTRLTAKTRDRSYSTVLAPEDVARVQEWLNGVDVRLGSLPPARPRTGFFAALCGVVLLAPAAIALEAAGAVLWTSVVCLLRPRRASAAALGMAAAGCMTLAVAWAWWPDATRSQSLLLLAAVLATGALAAAALRSGGAAGTAGASDGLLLLGLPALGFLGFHALFAGGALELHEIVRATPSAVVLSLALAGALLASRAGWARGLGAGALVLACAQLGIGTDAFRVWIASEPLTARSTPFALESWLPVVDQVQAVDPAAVELRVSPAGEAFAIGLVDRDAASDEDAAVERFSFGLRGGALRTIAASDFEFVGETRALALVPSSDGFSVVLVSLHDEDRQTLAEEPGLRAADLRVHAPSGRFTVAAYAEPGAELVRVGGRVGEPRVELASWGRSRDGTYPLEPAATAEALLALRRDYGTSYSQLRMFKAMLLERPPNLATRIVALTRDEPIELARTHAPIACALDARAEARYVCSVRANGRDELWEFDAGARRSRALGSVQVGYHIAALHAGELLTAGERLQYVKLDERRAFRAVGALQVPCARAAAVSERFITLLGTCDEQPRIHWLRKPGAPPRGADLASAR